jgi:hypothetical protein
VPLVALAAPAGAPSGAEAITDRLDQAGADRAEGDVGGAITEQELATQAMRGWVAAGLLATFPGPPAGRSAEDGDGSAGANPLMRGSMVSRSCRRHGGSGRIGARRMTGGGFVQGMAAMMTSPQG